MSHFWLLRSALIIAAGASAQAQSQPASAPTDPPVILERSSTHDLKADDGYTYRISIAEPTGKPPAAGYAVLYVLDANQNFLTAVQTTRFQKGIVPLVIVGVGHVSERPDVRRRYHDFTPPTPQDHIIQRPGPESTVSAADTGGEDAFLQFLQTKVRPDIERRFPLNPARQAIYGHSLSALFVLHVMATRPELFQIYLAASPSLWWNRESTLEEIDAFAKAGKSPGPITAFISAGEAEQHLSAEESPERAALLGSMKMVDNAKRAAEKFSTVPGIKATFYEFPGENHGSAAPMAISRAIRLTFSQGG